MPRAALAALLLLPSIGQAEIYKWVDDKGRTHYSQHKADAGRAPTTEVKPPPPPPAPSRPTEDWRAWSRASPPPPASAGAPFAPPAPRTRSLSGGREHGTDASRCALARDVLNGALQHSNGKPIDQYDLDVARNDVKSFCK